MSLKVMSSTIHHGFWDDKKVVVVMTIDGSYVFGLEILTQQIEPIRESIMSMYEICIHCAEMIASLFGAIL